MKEKYDVALVVGTRPNFVKAAPLLEYFEEKNVNTLFIHTGQHKDKKMSVHRTLVHRSLKMATMFGT